MEENSMDHDQRLKLAFLALRGTSIGDAFGESFFVRTEQAIECIRNRKIPKTTWEFTDDTVMTIAVFNQLNRYKTIVQDELATEFSKYHDLDPNRGYGATARRILRGIGEGRSWERLSNSVFEGMGSMGNGAAMRVTPIGAYYFDDIEKVKELAEKSAVITHSNIEGVTGAIAVAVGAAIATKIGFENQTICATEFIERVLEELPVSDTRSKISKSLSLPYSYDIETIRFALGDGSKILAQDTVPFSLWCVAHNLSSYEDAIWKAISILGDRDTICAIVGGISALFSPEASIPIEWAEKVESIERSVFW
jgi:ADP-ribosylglycohydrolase